METVAGEIACTFLGLASGDFYFFFFFEMGSEVPAAHFDGRDWKKNSFVLNLQ